MPIQHPAHLPWWQYQVIDTEQRSQSQGPHREIQVLQKTWSWSFWAA